MNSPCSERPFAPASRRAGGARLLPSPGLSAKTNVSRPADRTSAEPSVGNGAGASRSRLGIVCPKLATARIACDAFHLAKRTQDVETPTFFSLFWPRTSEPRRLCDAEHGVSLSPEALRRGAGPHERQLASDAPRSEPTPVRLRSIQSASGGLSDVGGAQGR
jgi:hypothetical protein